METGEIWEADDLRTVYKILVSHMRDYVRNNDREDVPGFSDCSGRICVTAEGTDFWRENMDDFQYGVSVMRYRGRCGVFVMRYYLDDYFDEEE